ncbi:MAG: DUF2948 family protein [Rhodobiaceae bacterium]|nr:DUF2948 family protein [Rhodobiaceae bacterium]
MQALKLIALDADDMAVVAAHLQDAVVRVGDLAFLPKQRRFAGLFNRFAWETAATGTPERRRAALRIERVTAVRRSGIDQKRPEAVFNLLSLQFTPGQSPGGTIDMEFSGGGTIRLEVECVEIALGDLGGAWAARAVPDHDGEDA